MSLNKHSILWLATTLTAACNPAFGSELPQKQRIDAVVKPLIDAEEVVGAVVGIMTPDGNHILSYGSTSYSEKDVPDGDTIFEIGSLTKVFTGVLLAEMVSQDLVKLDDQVSMYLPEGVMVPNVAGKEITLLHLATHTAGFARDPRNLRPKDPLNRFADYTEKQLYLLLTESSEPVPNRQSETEKSEAPANLAYQYSNVGIGLLGHLLERKEGKPFERLVAERICDALEMNDTHIKLDDEQRNHLATGYYFYDQVAPKSSAGCIPGYGGLRSTANDLLKFLAVHLRDDDLSVATAAQIASSPKHEVDDNLSVGLCWHIDTKSGVVWHGGTTTGFTSAMAFNKESGFGVVVLTNSKSLVITPLAGAILAATQGNEPKPIPIRKRIRIDDDVLESYLGTYQDKNKPFLAALRSTKTVIREGKHLKVKGLNPTERFPLFPESETGFFCKGENIYAKFKLNDDGKVLGMELNLWGYKSELTKLD